MGGRRFVVAQARRPQAALFQSASAARPGLHVIDGQIVGVCGDGGVIPVRGTAGRWRHCRPRSRQTRLPYFLPHCPKRKTG
ncbi:hypothetical protein ACU4GD_00835 [Cupriavidus basilensis]